MQVNPASNTIKGLGIATIVLSAFALIISLASFAFVQPLGILIEEAIDLELYSEIPSTVVVSSSDIAKLEDAENALSALNKEELAGVEQILTALAASDWKTVASLTDVSDPEKLQNLIDAAASLTDQDIQHFAEMTGSTEDIDDMKEARDWAASITPAQVRKISSAIADISASGISGAVSGFVIAGINILILLAAICAVVSMIAGILSTKNAYKPEKLGAAFVWCVIACILALCTARMVSVVVLIILAIYISKARKTPLQTQSPDC